MGLALARRALLRGDLVIVTARDVSRFDQALFSDPSIDRANTYVQSLDISWPIEKLLEIAADAVQHWGRVDVLVGGHDPDTELAIHRCR